MAFDFSGKKALVTGAGQGIGREIAKALADANAEVYAISRSAEPLEALKKEKPLITTICCDLADLDKARECLKPFLPFHLLVNNAGTNVPQPFFDITEETYDKIMHINAKVPLFISQLVTKSMVENDVKGSVVNVSSVVSLVTMKDYTSYMMSKSAMNGLTRMMGLELGPQGIRTNGVNPTTTMTGLGVKLWSDPVKCEAMQSKIPLGRFAQPEEVVNAVLFLLSPQASMINGVSLPVDGGRSNC